MGKFVKVAQKSALPEGTGMVLTVEGKEVALFNASGSFHAIDSVCKHQGGPLGDGSLEGTTVMCPWHGWEYDVTTGGCLTNPNAHQTTYNLKVEGDDVLIEI